MTFDDEVRAAVRSERFLVLKALVTLALVGAVIVLHTWLS